MNLLATLSLKNIVLGAPVKDAGYGGRGAKLGAISDKRIVHGSGFRGLNYCAQAGLGEADLRKIEVVGEPIAKHVRRYKLADNIAQQLVWMTPPKPS
jgi:hypothetical protein